MTNSVCNDLDGVLNTDKDFVVVAIGGKDNDKDNKGKNKTLVGQAAVEKNCERHQKQGKTLCLSTSPKATDFTTFFPMCMVIRPVSV